MKRLLFGLSVVSVVAWSATTVWGFCGFYVAKADTKIFNEASQVVLVRDGDRTVMTMVNDYKGEVKDFAVVIPVPTFLQRGRSTLATRRSSITSTRIRRRASSSTSIRIRACATR